MNTASVLRAWTEREPAVQIAEKVGMDRGMMSRHVNGHAQVSAKHLAAYLQVAPEDIKSQLLGAWLMEKVPSEYHELLLGRSGDSIRAVVEFEPTVDKELRDALQFLANHACVDPELRKRVLTFARWMGYEPAAMPESISTNTQNT